MSGQQTTQVPVTRYETATPTAPSRIASMRASWSPWIAKGSLAILDQTLISGSNFLISVLLARWLGPEAYGAFALAFSIFLLFLIVYQSLILEPMSVFGPANYRACLREYLGILLRIHAAISTAAILILGVTVLVIYEFALPRALIGALLGAMLAVPCVLLFWLARRAFYLELSPGRAASGALLYCGLLSSGLGIIYRTGLLSPFTAFFLMAIGGLGTGVLLLMRLKPILRPRTGNPNLSTVGRQHWAYGSWALGSAVAGWVPWNISYVLVSSFHGMADTASLRALLNLALPMRQSYAAFSLLLLPHAAGAGQQNGQAGVKGLASRITALFALGAVTYWCVLTLFRQPVMRFLYGGNYLEMTSLIPWIALASVLSGAIQGPSIILRAMQSPASVFAVNLVSSAVALAVGIPCIRAFGVRGAVYAVICSSVISLALSYLLLRRTLRRASEGADEASA